MTDHRSPNVDNSNKKMCGSTFNNGIDFSQAFHTYTGIWLQDRIEWHTTDNSGNDLFMRSDYPYYIPVVNTPVCSINPGFYFKSDVFPVLPMAIFYDIALNSTNFTASSPRIMQVDYVKYYAPAFCSSIVISDPSPYNYSGTDNFICAKNVTLNCSFNTGTNTTSRLDIVGQTGVILGPGFSVSNNASVRIDGSMGCQ
jgi:beta-glucanase (GH16 family)